MAKRTQGRAGPLFSDTPITAELVATGETRMEDLTNAQVELINVFEEANRRWLDHMQTEADLASEFTSKFTAARSIPDAMKVCQEWASQRMALLAEDGRQSLAHSQMFVEIGMRLRANGSLN